MTGAQGGQRGVYPWSMSPHGDLYFSIRGLLQERSWAERSASPAATIAHVQAAIAHLEEIVTWANEQSERVGLELLTIIKPYDITSPTTNASGDVA